MKLKCLIVEDDPLQVKGIEKLLAEITADMRQQYRIDDITVDVARSAQSAEVFLNGAARAHRTIS